MKVTMWSHLQNHIELNGDVDIYMNAAQTVLQHVNMHKQTAQNNGAAMEFNLQNSDCAVWCNWKKACLK